MGRSQAWQIRCALSCTGPPPSAAACWLCCCARVPGVYSFWKVPLCGKASWTGGKGQCITGTWLRVSFAGQCVVLGQGRVSRVGTRRVSFRQLTNRSMLSSVKSGALPALSY